MQRNRIRREEKGSAQGREVTPMQVWLALGVGLLVLVGLTKLFAPDKPAEPPPSTIEYGARNAPDSPAAWIGGDPGEMGNRPGRPHSRSQSEPEIQEGVESEPIIVYGTVTDQRTGKPISGAYIGCERRMAQDEFEGWRKGEFEYLVPKTEEGVETAETAAPSMGVGVPLGAPLESPGVPGTTGLPPGSLNNLGGFTAAPEGTSGTDESWNLLRCTRRTYSNDEGRYAFRIPLKGSYLSSAWRQGYPGTSQALEVPEGELKVRLDFVLDPGGTISGRVTERVSGKGAPGIVVHPAVESLLPDNPGVAIFYPPRQDYGEERNSVKTGPDGRYTLTGLPAANVRVFLRIDDAPYQFAGLPPERLVTVPSGQDIKNVDFVVDAAGVVWGYVWNPDRTPATNVEVILCKSSSILSQIIEGAMRMRPPLTDGTDENGFYSIGGVPINQESRVFGMTNSFAPQLSDPFVVTDKHREVRVDLFLKPGTTVSGRVLSTVDRQPVPKADVMCMPSFSKLATPFEAPAGFRDTRTDDRGYYSLAHLPPGAHTLYANAEGYKLSISGEAIFSDGATDQHVDLWVTPVDSGEYTVFGRVADSAGRAVANADVALVGVAVGLSGFNQETRTDSEGNYAFFGVEAGMLMIHVQAEGYAPREVGDVKLDAPTDIELEAGSSIRGRVLVRETNAPPDSFRVRLLPSMLMEADLAALGGMEGRTFSGTDGAFEAFAPAGTYTVSVSAADLTPAQKSVEVEAGQTADAGTLYLTSKGGRITGKVITRDGKNPAGASVELGQQGGSFASLLSVFNEEGRNVVSVGEDGVFEFAHLGAGTYMLTAKLGAYADGRSDPIQLDEGETESGVELVLGSGGKLQGSVAIRGESAPGAIVTATSGSIRRVATADRNGQYTFEDLPPGQYLVSGISIDLASQGVFAPVHGEASIREGQTTTLNLGDGSGATIEGFCNPSPPVGKMAFAVLRIAGTGADVATLNLHNMMSWFADPESAASSIVGFAQVERSDGFFRIENAPQGQYVLDVYYLDLADVMGRGGRRVFSGPVNIAGTETIQMEVTVEQ